MPIYYGAPNVADWLPNELSAISIDEYSSAKDLAEHLLYLHKNEGEYLAHLQHKPSVNSNKLSLITNNNLIDMMLERSWGVSDEAQLDKGNFVQVFECLVCARVAQNVKMTKIGFGKMPYDANEDHYGCPSPHEDFRGTLSKAKHNWWQRHWNQAYYESEVLLEFVNKKMYNYSRSDFYDRVLELIREDNVKLFNNNDDQ